ncbi:MAG: signal peptidase I [Clostridiales bacterium]|nr:signal peptidase I [Clostridiales bacterium]
MENDELMPENTEEENTASETENEEDISGVDADISVSDDDGATEKPKKFRDRLTSNIYDIVSIVGTAIIAIMLVFSFVFRFVGVEGPSMEPTLIQDDWLAVTAYLGTPQSGDIVIITQPNAFNEPIVKRVIAVGGQTIDIKNGYVYIDGEKITEKYISPEVVTEVEDITDYPLTIPEGKVFVMGDNRPHSTDSRSNMIGMISDDYIIGKVAFRLIPFGNFKVGMTYDY